MRGTNNVSRPSLAERRNTISEKSNPTAQDFRDSSKKLIQEAQIERLKGDIYSGAAKVSDFAGNILPWAAGGIAGISSFGITKHPAVAYQSAVTAGAGTHVLIGLARNQVSNALGLM